MICTVPCSRASGKNQGGTSTNEHGRGFQPRCPQLNVFTASEGYEQLRRAWANGWVFAGEVGGEVVEKAFRSCSTQAWLNPPMFVK